MLELIFKYEFLQNAFIAGILIGIIAPLIGSFIILKRLSYLADTLSHVTLAGVTIGMYLSKVNKIIDPIYIGIIFSMITSLILDKLRNIFKNFKEISMTIIMSGAIAISLIFAQLSGGYSGEFFSFLFGSITTISRRDVYNLVILTIFILVFVYKLYYPLLAITFDEKYGQLTIKRYKTIQILFTLSIAFTISFSIKIVGSLLIASLIVIPITAAIKIANSFRQTIIYGIIFSEISIITGLVASYYLNLPSGAMIVGINLIILVLVLIFTKEE